MKSILFARFFYALALMIAVIGILAIVPVHAAAPAAKPQDKAKLASILKNWEAKSEHLNSLEISVVRKDVNPAWGDPEVFHGQAFLEKPDRARLDFWKVVEQPGKAARREDQERVIFTGKSVLQYIYPTKQIYVYSLNKQQQMQALDEGPLPFLFNFNAKKASERYTFEIENENQSTYLLKVEPKLAADREAFSMVHLWLNKKTFFPDKLWLIQPNGKDRKEYQFPSIKAKDRLDPNLFTGKKLEGWTVVKDPGPGERSAQRVQPPRRD